ncbi:hypothetical protein P167DRAFT_329972 [Morchella conica CCBAS932]|uniref:Fungal N-terminal domain-containing protein n=1 Tax=Morchella conica CCBAS932 TaxID=1392247 RepID=A0A3N4KT28_9PEZI|nr:hypothetical protein P167DRAFT_329972 [Morchella conica CCBAS932]
MADGLSLVANIIAVVQLVGGVGRYINEVKGASKSLKDFEREIESLRSILLKLRTFAEENPVIADSWSLTAPLDKCAADMTRINLELALVPKKKIWGIQLFWCQWPFKEKETLGFIERSERLKSIFILAMGELQQWVILDFLSLTFTEFQVS